MRFLERLNDTARARLGERMVLCRYVRNEVIIGQDEPSRDFFIVLDGVAHVTIFSEDGKIVAFRDLFAGDIFGEYAAIDGDPRSTSVVAGEDIDVGRLSSGQFRELVETDAEFTWSLLRHMSVQARSMTERIFEFSTMMVRDRLIAELLRLAEIAGARGERATLTPAPTHFDLAVRISSHREAVSREMSRLAKLDLVSKRGGSLILHDLARLGSG